MARPGNGIKAAKVSPAYLHSNSTSHTWPFSAIAELIDNAYDPDVGAKEISIDHRVINENDTLCFEDNGHGMDHEQLFKMLSFGFSEKTQVRDVKPIGRYGNGFKSGSMRLGDDVLVFTRCTTSASVGMLSQTYLKAINAESVLVPIVTWDLPTDDFQNNKEDAMANLQAIGNHSIFKSKSDVLTALRSLEKMKTGTNIIIYNLKRNKENTHELDFTSDPDDIRNPETAVFDDTNINRPVNTLSHEYKRSLREYCSILYLKPRMTIVLRGKKVKTKFILKSLRRTETDVYKPRWLDQPLKLTFGFTTSKKREEYGLMLYNKNRLIRAYEKVGCQTKANEHGVGVVGVIEADFLEPIHNKQKFNRDEKYTAFMQRAASKLNDYYYEKTNTQDPDNVDDSMSEIPDWTWAQCDNCLQWRRLPLGYTDKLPENWYCRLNPDSAFNRCDIPEEPENEDEALQASYNKTYKKKQEEERRLQKGKEKVPPSEDKVDRKTSSDEDQDDYNQSLQKKLLDQQAKIHELEQEERRVKQRNADLLCSAGRLKLSEIISPKLMDKLQSSADTSSSAFTLGSPSISAPKRKNTIPEVIPDKIRKMMVEDTVAYGDFATTDSGLDDTLFFPSSAETDTSIKRGVSAMHLPQEGTSINYQTKVFEQTACQTDPTTFISPEEMQEIGQTKLNLLEAKDKLRDIRIKIWKMLKIIVPDFDYGMPEDIEGVISDFINVHEQGDPAELA